MQFVFSENQIEELRVICEGCFKQEFSTEEARVMAINLFEFYQYFCDFHQLLDASNQPMQSGQAD